MSIQDLPPAHPSAPLECEIAQDEPVVPVIARVCAFFLDLGQRAAVVAVLLAAADLAAIVYYRIGAVSPGGHGTKELKFLLAGTFGAEELALIAGVVAWVFAARLQQRTAEARGIALISACLAMPTAAVLLFPGLLGAI